MGRLLSIIISVVLLPLSALTLRGEILDGYMTVDSVARRMESLPLCPAEGVWEMAGDGAVFAVERTAESATETLPRELRLVIIRSPHRRVRPGSVMGTARPTVKPGVYEARLNTRIADLGGLSLPHKFLLTVGDENSTLTIEPFKSPLKVNLLRLIPYLYRAVRLQESRPRGLDGAIRVYPPTTKNPLTPIYL